MIDVIFGRLGGGDNPTFWHVMNLCGMSGTPCLSGFWGVGGGFGVCARGFECGGWALLGLLGPF